MAWIEDRPRGLNEEHQIYGAVQRRVELNRQRKAATAARIAAGVPAKDRRAQEHPPEVGAP